MQGSQRLSVARAEQSPRKVALRLKDERLQGLLSKRAFVPFLMAIFDLALDTRVDLRSRLASTVARPSMIPSRSAIRRWVRSRSFFGSVLGLCFSFGLSSSAPAGDKHRPRGAEEVYWTLRTWGRFGLGSACPIELPTRARWILTVAHVVDPRPFEKDVPLFPFTWDDRHGSDGRAHVISLSVHRDIARVDTREGSVQRYLPVAKLPPKEGDRVWALGYNRDKRQRGFEDELFEMKVRRVMAAHLEPS